MQKLRYVCIMLLINNVKEPNTFILKMRKQRYIKVRYLNP